MNHSLTSRPRAIFGLLFGLLIATSSQGQILKCLGPKGQVEFSNQSCQTDWARQELALKENTVSHSGAREQTLLLENQRLKEQLQKAQGATPASSAAGPTNAAGDTRPLTESDLQAQRLKAPACEDAARRYEIAAGSIAPIKEVIAARRSAMFAACGIAEPESVIVNTQVQVEVGRPCLKWGWRLVQSRTTTQFHYVRACLIIG